MIKKLITRFLQWFCNPDFYDEIQGDLEEIYQRNLSRGNHYAQRKYFFQIIILFRPSLMRPFFQKSIINTGMFRSYLKISSRILWRQKFYTTINVLGLAVGMGVCLLICQYIYFEKSFDRFHEKADSIYRITQTAIRNGEVLAKGVDVTYGLGAEGKKSIPEVKEMVRIVKEDIGYILINEEKHVQHQENNIWFADANFLEMFSFPLKYGDPSSALKEMYNIVLTETMAIKYFSHTDIFGEQIRISAGVYSGEFVVTGILENIPENSHLQFDFLLPLNYILEKDRSYKVGGGWFYDSFATYIRMDDDVDKSLVAKKFDDVILTNMGENLKNSNMTLKTGFQPLTAIHLHSKGLSGQVSENNGDENDIHFFALIGIFILIIAWINYINLSTARAMQRRKEVGVRKSIGAVKSQLMYQFLTESALINLLAASIAIMLTIILMPLLNNLVDHQLNFTLWQSPVFLVGFLFSLAFGTFLSGLYPAFILSGISPVNAFKTKINYHGKTGINLRKGLIIFQFMIAVTLVAGTYLVYQQIQFMKQKDLGYELNKILVLNGPRVVLESLKSEGTTLLAKYQTFKNHLLSHHSVAEVSASGDVPGKGYMFEGGIRKLGDGKEMEKITNATFIDASFSQIYNFEFLAGKPFSDEMSNRSGIIINEKLRQELGFNSPEEALFQKLLLVTEDTLEIKAVVKNVYWNSLKNPHQPGIYWLDHDYGAYFSIQFNTTNLPETISHIEKSYKKVFPNDPFEFTFLDEDFNRQYKSDLQFGKLFSVFSVLAILIACLGLFALVSFSASLRIKEIGIRKVLGASMSNLMFLLSKEYFLLLAVAIFLAFPIVIFWGNSWLENFAFKTEIGIDLFLIPTLVFIVISLITVSYKTFSTAKANPVKALKVEN
ncbi:FtsX-like permease family protein [Flexithrix dorotheae]|uniref:FtsX-like permease family protein n=1 Tax=Flexithrix dorotheae TaxID=70993 RepID=UPI00037C00CC|nr:FtsX-like permease family protein [Flexithrix dorotheae]